MENSKTLNLILIGSGGDGVMVTADMILKTAARRGLYGLKMQSYGPQIRGGEAAAHVSLSTEPISVIELGKEMIVCFRFADVGRFAKEFRPAVSALLFHGAEGEEMPEIFQKNPVTPVSISFAQVLEQNQLPEISKNVFLFGVLLKTLGWELEEGKECVQEIFSSKSKEVLEGNRKALEKGYAFAAPRTLPVVFPDLPQKRERWVLSGNEACARAAVEAGCRFYSGYPITPSSEILEEMHRLLSLVDGKLIQAEDEISALGMVIGASYGGVPAMTATSGPGLSLMTEMIGLASMAEIPAVIVDCQRGGPSTGIPSRTEQSDLWHALYGGHGDFPRVVLAATDVAHCFPTMFRAFWCAERYQLPVIVLSDAQIAQSAGIIDPVATQDFPKGGRKIAKPSEETYRRFDFHAAGNGGDGVTPMAIPGTPRGMHSIAGIEHTEEGFPSADTLLHEAMNRKRFLKIQDLAEASAGWHSTFGSPSAETGIVAWGSSAGVAKALARRQKGFAVFVPEILHPFPLEGLKQFLRLKKSVFVLEMNYQGHLFHALRAWGAIDGKTRSIRRSGGIPFQIEELKQRFKQGGTDE